MIAKDGELIDKAGQNVSVRAVVQQKYTEPLEKEGYSLKRTGIIERPFDKKDDTEQPAHGNSNNGSTGGNEGGDGNGGGDNGDEPLE